MLSVSYESLLYFTDLSHILPFLSVKIPTILILAPASLVTEPQLPFPQLDGANPTVYALGPDEKGMEKNHHVSMASRSVATV